MRQTNKLKITSWGEPRKFYDGFIWSIISFLSLGFEQSRPFSILVVLLSVFMCISYLLKNNKKIILSIIGIITDVFVAFVYITYYLF